ncbi:MAG: GWxTD domain-containing protein [Gracilimonas sp.]|uniref:GWxTD domain-containing protein n=1 Tax=Gracilimonas sp. TaxID=1974203 RepID=UPI0019CB2883|nr:GWxTD domain-containing protein [Gracilimonas sp.]MBD3616394.1 GWxTD domain-containing protein [Gracilimonas sp.]
MLRSNTYLLILIGILCAGFFSISCSDSYINNVKRGGWYEYTAGFPELRLSTTRYYNEQGIPIINVSGDVVYGGLIYKQNDDGDLQADITIDIVITDIEEDKLVAENSFSESLTSEKNSVIYSQDLFRFTELFEVNPGEYEIMVTVTDVNSEKQMVRTSTANIEDIDEKIVSISEVQIFGKETSVDGAEFVPVTTYDVPANLDSLKFMIQVNNSTGFPINIRSNLKKFYADTTIAWPMSIQNYPRSSIRYQGIEYDEFEILQSGSRTINQNGYIFIEYSYGELDLGNYRLEIFIEGEHGLRTEGGREFGIKPEFYPAVKTTRQMAEPLAYIMTDKEYEQLMSIENEDSLKMAMDRFWLSNIKNSNLAEEVISLYYHRVEEANKQFSNYKEGWKTDLGMVYILFGPPWSVNDVFNSRVILSYTYNLDDPERNYLFRVSDIKGKYFPFDNYILQRKIYYHTLEYRQKQRWRTGSILTVDL